MSYAAKAAGENGVAVRRKARIEEDLPLGRQDEQLLPGRDVPELHGIPRVTTGREQAASVVRKGQAKSAEEVAGPGGEIPAVGKVP